MDFGLLIFATDYAIAPDVLARRRKPTGLSRYFCPSIRIYLPVACRLGLVGRLPRVLACP